MALREDQVVSLAKQHFEGVKNVHYLSSIPLRKVMSVSGLFPEIKLSSENLLMVTTDEEGKYDIALTSKQLYIRADSESTAVNLNDIEVISKVLSAAGVESELQNKITNFLNQVSNKGNKEPEDITTKLDSSSFDEFVNRMKDLSDIIEDKANSVINRRREESGKDSVQKVRSEHDPGAVENGDKEEPASDRMKDLVIDEDFLDLLQLEGNKLWDLVFPLNEDKAFINILHKAISSSSDIMNKEFGAEHVIIQDIIRIYQLCDTPKTPIKEIKAQYSLAYLFERLQGKDMISMLSPARINEMVEKDKFIESIEKLKKANYLKLPASYDGQLLMPSLLSRLKHPLFEKCAAHYIRFANVILKADGDISPEEEIILKKINRLTTKPRLNLAGVKQSEVPDGETLEDVMKELNQLIGLENIKTDIESLINFLTVQAAREEQELSTTDRTLHAVFMGPPGTGKTTVARLLARIYKHLGYISNGHLVETDRAGLVAGYIGQTAIKVDEVIQTAIDGVLFIDEAYALSRGDNGRDFGNEAVETLLKRMEDHRKDLVVIVAGYPNEMTNFVESNPGLQSRFNRYFKFNHYNGTELLNIFKLFAGKADFLLDEEAEEKLSFIFDGMYADKDEHFGNARVARNLFEEIVSIQANRIVSIKELSREVLMTLKEPDIPPVKETIQKYLEFGEVK